MVYHSFIIRSFNSSAFILLYMKIIFTKEESCDEKYFHIVKGKLQHISAITSLINSFSNYVLFAARLLFILSDHIYVYSQKNDNTSYHILPVGVYVHQCQTIGDNADNHNTPISTPPVHLHHHTYWFLPSTQPAMASVSAPTEVLG